MAKKKIEEDIKPEVDSNIELEADDPVAEAAEEVSEEAEEAVDVVTVEVDVIVVAVPAVPTDQPPGKKYYFNNPVVEALLNRYVESGCTEVALRDEIMSHAGELIRQIIRAHNFEHIYPGRDQSSFNELFQVAWMQIEKTLYKYDPTPGSPKVFNMWSQIAKTRILAYLKKEKRDKKNVGNYKDFLVRRHKTKSKSIDDFQKYLTEAEGVCDCNQDFLDILKAIRKLWTTDDKPHDGFITKLEKLSGKNRHVITLFLKTMRLRMDEFTINMADIKGYRDYDLAGDEAYHFNDHDA